MRRAGRLIWGLARLVAVVLILAILALLVMGAITTQRGLPQTSGTITLDGLHRPVTVARDRAGIIQITADDPHDLFVAQGYVHAQERMWQMEISRRIGAGRLAELFGKGQVDRDRYIRTLGWRVAAERDLAAMSPEAKAVLRFYADGVNAWISENQGRLSTPFVVAGLLSGSGGIGGITLEPWTPLDTATWQKVQAWSLGGNVDSEIFRFLADARLGAAKTDELFPPYDANQPVITPTEAMGEGSGGPGAPSGPGEPGEPGEPGASPDPGATPDPDASPDSGAPSEGETDGETAAALLDLGHAISGLSSIAGFDRGGALVGSHGVGSNNWVVSGSRTMSGKPILANDPHLGFGMPSVWIMNGLHCRTVSEGCRWDVVGVSFPGAPAVVLGHNARIAWGATNVNPDTQDLFLETVDQSDPNRYIFQGASVPFEVRREVIRVGGGADVQLDVRSSRHGPILSDVDERLAGGPVLALRWTTTAEADLALETFFEINVASTFEEFRAAFDGYGSPSQNFIYADVDGHIGYVLPGLIPIRQGGPIPPCLPDTECPIARPDTGERVRDGASGQYEWTGYVPRDQLPWQLDPDAGQIVSANNAPVDSGYAWFLGNEFDPGYRAARITQRLGQLPGKVNAEDMRAIQQDTYLRRADDVIPALQSLGITPATDDGRTLWSRIVDWDRQCGVESVGCAAFAPVELALTRAIFDDELGELAPEWVGSPFSWEAVADVLRDPASGWWNVVGPDGSGGGATRGAADTVVEVLDRTAAQLRADLGDPSGWTWGRIHQVQFRESTLGSSGIPPLEWYFNPAGRAVAGADGAVNNNYYRVGGAYPDPDDPGAATLDSHEVFAVTNGPSYRLTIDMGDIDGARIIITTGQSGNPLDPHYGDLIPLWAEGQTVPLPFSPGIVAASAVQTLTLSPP